MSAQQFLTLESDLDKARRLRTKLEEIGEMLCNLYDFEYLPGMAILRSAEEMADGLPSVRIIEHTEHRLTVFDPGVGLHTLHQAVRPIVDVSDPATFGYVFAMGFNMTDDEADEAYRQMDFGGLDNSAWIIIKTLSDQLPF